MQCSLNLYISQLPTVWSKHSIKGLQSDLLSTQFLNLSRSYHCRITIWFYCLTLMLTRSLRVYYNSQLWHTEIPVISLRKWHLNMVEREKWEASLPARRKDWMLSYYSINWQPVTTPHYTSLNSKHGGSGDVFINILYKYYCNDKGTKDREINRERERERERYCK